MLSVLSPESASDLGLKGNTAWADTSGAAAPRGALSVLSKEETSLLVLLTCQ